VLHEHTAGNFYWIVDRHAVVKVITVHVELSCDLPLEMTTANFVDLFCPPGSTNGFLHTATKRRRYISSLIWELSVWIIRTMMVIVS
jgi:hypothetical protein